MTAYKNVTNTKSSQTGTQHAAVYRERKVPKSRFTLLFKPEDIKISLNQWIKTKPWAQLPAQIQNQKLPSLNHGSAKYVTKSYIK
jgi:hypothetical protein